MQFAERFTNQAIGRPKTVFAVVSALCAGLIVLVVLPLIAPQGFAFLAAIDIDTDPENMLSESEPVREFHDEMRHILSLNDMIVVGVVNDVHPSGVFNPESLSRIFELTEFAKTLHGEAIGQADPNAGVVEVDIIAPSTVDNIEQGGLGVVRFEWLMQTPPATQEEADAVLAKAQRLPFLNGTLVSEDGKAIALYLPITSKDLSYRVATRLQRKIAELGGDDVFHITGLPVAEDTFGVEMFKQMAISAPLAMLVIFILLFIFFRKLILIISPMIVAMASVIITMGLLIVSGQTIHIMSSMIPIFIMPIAVLDSVHILSEFFDRYQQTHDRRKTIVRVMKHLFKPMLFTSLTSTAGFASLALTPIPPVQVFGVFVAIGVMTAWILTITLVPAYVMLIPERRLQGFGLAHKEGEAVHAGIGGHVLRAIQFVSYRGAPIALIVTGIIAVIAAYGISQIQINDNPTKWFKPSHPIRVADRVLNDHFGGTYMAYLAFQTGADEETVASYAEGLRARTRAHADQRAEDVPEMVPLLPEFLADLERLEATATSPDAFIASVAEAVQSRIDAAEGGAVFGWEEYAFLVEDEALRTETFKRPDVLRYIEQLQDYLLTTHVVGKSNSLADIVKTVHRELFEGAAEKFVIPETLKAVAQCLITFESSHRPHDLYHFVTPDYRTTSIWVQLTSGDNRDMAAVVAAVDAYIDEHPPPANIDPEWFGLTYINVVWQEKMVSGMLAAFLGSFLVVLLMMVVLFRSGLWGFLSMIPLTITIGAIYGVIGLIGKDYDMPVAVLSSLTLGLAIDFAIHFLSRSRELYKDKGTWRATNPAMFGEPARAITRNVIVIAIGFLPLLAAPLVPYNTVGVFMAAILFVSGAGTLVILPAIIRYAEPVLFPKSARARRLDRALTYFVLGVTVTVFAAMNVLQFTAMSLTAAIFLSALIAGVGIVLYHLFDRKQSGNPVEGSPS